MDNNTKLNNSLKLFNSEINVYKNKAVINYNIT